MRSDAKGGGRGGGGRGGSNPPRTRRALARMNLRDPIERWLEAERDQLPLWLPVALGGGIVAWFALPDPRAWQAAMAAWSP